MIAIDVVADLDGCLSQGADHMPLGRVAATKPASAGSRVIGSGLFFGVRDGNEKRKTGIRGDRLEFRSFLFF